MPRIWLYDVLSTYSYPALFSGMPKETWIIILSPQTGGTPCPGHTNYKEKNWGPNLLSTPYRKELGLEGLSQSDGGI